VADLGAGGGRSESADRIQHEIERLRAEMIRLRRSRTRLLLAADADRRTIERTLHDGLQQQLVAIAVMLRRAADLVDDDPVAAKASLDELAALVREGIDETAKLALWIHPPRLLDGRGLARALRSAADRADVALSIQVSTAASAAPEVIAGIYWCCVDALSAAPAATHATVRVVDAEGGVRFEVGVACTYSEELLDRLRDRVEALGGRLGVEDTWDGGSRVEGTLPSSWS
jgi:signal transduction histidine kinase